MMNEKELKEAVEKLDGESLFVYTLLLQYFTENSDHLNDKFKKIVLQRISKGENLKERFNYEL